MPVKWLAQFASYTEEEETGTQPEFSTCSIPGAEWLHDDKGAVVEYESSL